MTNVLDILAANAMPYPMQARDRHATDEQLQRRVRGEISYLVRATLGDRRPPEFYRLSHDRQITQVRASRRRRLRTRR